jgi:hypothetical protein
MTPAMASDPQAFRTDRDSFAVTEGSLPKET